jgi:hypothetical protein
MGLPGFELPCMRAREPLPFHEAYRDLGRDREKLLARVAAEHDQIAARAGFPASVQGCRHAVLRQVADAEQIRDTLSGEVPKWARQDSNLGPTDYESAALTAELRARLPRA